MAQSSLDLDEIRFYGHGKLVQGIEELRLLGVVVAFLSLTAMNPVANALVGHGK